MYKNQIKEALIIFLLINQTFFTAFYFNNLVHKIKFLINTDTTLTILYNIYGILWYIITFIITRHNPYTKKGICIKLLNWHSAQ